MTARAARAVRGMSLAKASVVVFVAGGAAHDALHGQDEPGRGRAGSRRTPSKVPHYFGPWPNWALSPLTLPDASVVVTDTAGVGTGATATAAVGANGVVTGITVTNPGTGYLPGTVAVSITGAGTGATASAVVTTSGVVTGVTVNNNGAGYTAARRHHLRRRRHHDCHGERVRRRRRGHAHQRRQRLHVPDGRVRRAGRPQRHAGQGARRLRRGHRCDHRASSSTRPARATRPLPASSSATARCWTRSSTAASALRPRPRSRSSASGSTPSAPATRPSRR